MNDIDRETLLAERHEIAKNLVFKYKTLQQVEQQKALEEAKARNMLGGGLREPTKKRPRRESYDREESGEMSDGSMSSSSGRSRSSYDSEESYSSDYDASDASYSRRR